MTKINPRLLLALSVLPVAIGAAGCGNGDDEASASTKPLTKVQFIKKADKVCEVIGNEQIKLAAHEFQKTHNLKEEDVIASAVIPPLEKQLRKLKSLPAPTKDAAKLAAWFRAFEHALKVAKEDPPAIVRTFPFQRADDLAKRYGFFDCAAAP
jgi:hypothetical protein